MIFPFPREGRAGHGPDNLALEKVITTFRQGRGLDQEKILMVFYT